jgi:hypothetical protein
LVIEEQIEDYQSQKLVAYGVNYVW